MLSLRRNSSPVCSSLTVYSFDLITGYRNDYGGRGGGGRGRGGRGGYDDRSDSYRGGRGGDRRDSARYDNRGPPMGGGYGGRGVGGPSMSAPLPAKSSSSILPPATGRAGKGQVFTEEKLKTRAKSMRQEWMEYKNEEELLLSMDEVLGSPDAGKIIVQTNVEYALEAKAPERAAINDIIVILFTKGRLTPTDVQDAMTDLVEFIDSFACDSPGAFGYVGEMLANFLNIKAVTIPWLCDATSRCLNQADKFKLIDNVVEAMKSKFGDSAVRACFGGPSEVRALEALLGPDFQGLARKI